ncbi:hypothetical protein ACFVJ4_37350 [Streptomyces sp. NPDC127178]|uniref:hypothetical protein n=1 Tax=unclassified Streptomyces TaxID=2593676 RepID=UPI00363A1856
MEVQVVLLCPRLRLCLRAGFGCVGMGARVRPVMREPTATSPASRALPRRLRGALREVLVDSVTGCSF